ncbi:hypothetical protein BJP08_00165 [Corynebacterium sp. NML140438]|uniref:DUF2188 domain-containing protein n=1 Tax=Corynebacterium sp. NML140438 TaxID=1906334 RepID=UPI0008FB3ADF|nr:DUF2188 domain-containing protein [Corynebacterium sp. NML140438]OIR46063.1 hypothetical protein BJP08_00165 [Corynebacterium sp. NML140438]
MGNRNTVHVTPNGGNGWRVASGGSKRAAGIFDTKAEAMKRGIEIAKNKGAEFYSHGRNGQIQNRNSYGNDPFPPRG